MVSKTHNSEGVNCPQMDPQILCNSNESPNSSFVDKDKQILKFL